MADSQDRTLRQVSWSILSPDFAAIEQMLADERERTHNPKMSQSDIARMVVARGVQAALRADNIASEASRDFAIDAELTADHLAWLDHRARMLGASRSHVIRQMVERAMYAEPHFDEEVA